MKHCEGSHKCPYGNAFEKNVCAYDENLNEYDVCPYLKDLLEMLKGIGVDWYAYPLHEQRGGAARLKTPEVGWSIEFNIPMFKGEEGRNFIERYVYVNEIQEVIESAE